MSGKSEKIEKVNVAGQEIVEGTAHMFYDTKETVFYNKVQVLNRDLSIQIIKLFSEKLIEERKTVYEQKLAKYNQHNATGNNTVPAPRSPKLSVTILDALAASGLRSIRYLKEIPLASHVTINDISEAATKLAQENCERNHVDPARVKINLQDATSLMYDHRNPQDQFDVIDLDPYGSAANFLDSAVQAVSDGGLLCVTCTDMTVLSGRYPEVCFSKYNSMPVRGKYVHEMSLRILLHSIDMTANKYKRYIVPWLSLSVDFYVRVFVRVYESAQEVKNSCLRRCMLFQSQVSPTYFIQPLAQNNHSGNYNAAKIKSSLQDEDITTYKIGGPFWQAPIHDQAVVDELLTRVKTYAETANELEKQLYPIPTIKRMTGILTVISEELKDVPFYYSLPELASTIKCGVPQLQEFSAALQNLGYRLSQFHHEPSAVKTDAPNEVIWDIMRAYHKLNPPAESKSGLPEIAKSILSKPNSVEVDFAVNNMRKPDKSVPRFPPNPEAFWGPKRRAGRKAPRDSEENSDEKEEERGDKADAELASDEKVAGKEEKMRSEKRARLNK